MDNRQSTKNVNNTPPDESQAENVLGATKRVLEVMEESKHNVTSLQNILKQEEQTLDELLNHVKTLKNSTNYNIAHLESNDAMKKTMEEYNNQFLNFAQMIYLSGQELYNELNSVGNKFETIDEKFAKNDAKYESRVEYYENVQKELLISLEELEKQHIENIQKRNYHDKENHELKHELKEINEKIKFYEEKSSESNQDVLSEEMVSCEKNIELLNNDIAHSDNKLKMLNQSLEEIKNEKLRTAEEVNKNIADIDHMCEELEKQLSSENCKLTEIKNKNIELCSKISDLETNCLLKSEKCVECTTNLTELQTQFSNMEENHRKEMAACENAILEKEEQLKNEKFLNSTLSDAMNNIRTKIDSTVTELADLHASIKKLENRPDNNLNGQLETKQNELEQVRSSKRALKEQIKNLESERATKINSEQREIEDLEEHNKTLMNDKNNLEAEIKQTKDETEKIELQNFEREKKMIQLASEIEILEVELRSKENSAKHNFVQPVRKVALLSGHTPNKPVKTYRNWDSDSSFEGEIKSFSKRGRVKAKMMKKVVSK
ncbi:unnamed protein product [Phaedon cochleariae]|uniref:Uncharacterized protein n=1 Tax=Phaedon cochleariae TaxID=80249 RepID=A0A9P0DI62_PHACE|nr:unnamed protein product [Phaedon cochleariae]